MADWRQNYNATGAPLPSASLVVTGTSGGDEGVRGFVAAYDQATGKEVWRFWTVPRRGEPKSETWQGKGIRASWRDDVVDRHVRSELNAVYWATGTRLRILIGDDRGGDNLYSDSVVALDAKTGALKWQLPVHAARRLGLRRAGNAGARRRDVAGGSPRKLLVHVNRNGFMYVLDRTNGAFLFGTQ
jgi:alcohol dehydrogenase (cytochrome c)